MKLLQINSVFKSGSTGRIASDISQISKKNGIDSYVAYGRGKELDSDHENLIKIGNNKDVLSHVVLTRIFDKHGMGSQKATKKLIDEIKEIRPDIIHLHNIHGYYVNVKILMNFLSDYDIPIVWTLHDCWAFTGHCAYFDFAGCEKWKTSCKKCPEKAEYPKAIVFDNSEENYYDKKNLFNSLKNLTIVTPSIWLGELTKKSFLSKYDVRVINNGVDLSTFKLIKSKFKERTEIKNKKIILGVASVWDRRKGLSYFLELSKIISKEEAIVVVGLNDVQMKNLPKNIFGIKKTDSIEELVDIYNAADVFFNPTLEDNFPTTNLEALACGVPVVTFNTGGSVESIDSKTGLIIDKNTDSNNQLTSLRNAMSTLKKEDCLNRAKSFNKNNKFNEYINLYKELNTKKLKVKYEF